MRVRILLVPFVAAAALLAGCTTGTPAAIPTPTTNGLESLSADEILAKAIDAVKSASSFRVGGTGEVDGDKTDIDLLVAGDDVKGSVTTGGIKAELVRVSGAAYLKAPEELWKANLPADIQALVLPLVAGKFVKLPASVSSLLPSVDDVIKPSGAVTKGDVTTIGGKPAITLKTTDGSMHVSLVGKPYPIDIVSAAGTVTFSGIDAGEKITAPAAAEVFDLSAFAG
jgi:hypothetical protein